MVMEERSSIQGTTYVLPRDEIIDEIGNCSETEGSIKNPKDVNMKFGNVLPNCPAPFEETNCNTESTQLKGKDIVIRIYELLVNLSQVVFLKM